MIYVTSDDVAYLTRPGTLEQEMNERWTHGQYLALFSTTGLLGSPALLHTKSFGALTMSITQAHVPTPDQRASSWLSRDLVLYGRSFKSVTNAKE